MMDSEKNMDEATFRLNLKDDIAIVSISGKLNNANTHLFNSWVNQAINKTGKVILDFSDLQYICSSNLGILVSANKRAESKGGQIVLSGMGTRVKNLMDIIGFSKIFKTEEAVFDTVEEAEEHLRAL